MKIKTGIIGYGVVGKKREKYINENNCSLTPAYDLLAMHLMLNPEFNDDCYDDKYENIMKKELVKHYS